MMVSPRASDGPGEVSKGHEVWEEWEPLGWRHGSWADLCKAQEREELPRLLSNICCQPFVFILWQKKAAQEKSDMNS